MTDDEIFAQNLSSVIAALGRDNLQGFCVVTVHQTEGGQWELSNSSCLLESRPGLALSMVAALGALVTEVADTVGMALDPDLASLPVDPPFYYGNN